MISYSPLRYPGGKSSLSGLLASIRNINSLGHLSFSEPFGGGAGAALTLLIREETPVIHINDADYNIYCFWWSIMNNTKEFCRLILNTELTIEEWRAHRDFYRSNRIKSRLKQGFSTFYLNRCNRSGIIMNGGPIGGLKQEGKWDIKARFSKKNLIARCEKIASYSDRIQIYGLDGIDFIENNTDNDTFLFIDPPYFEKGATLYLNSLDEGYHRALALKLRTMSDKPWVLTYDDCPEIRSHYEEWAQVRPFSLRYAASERRGGQELLIAPRWMKLPDHQRSSAIRW